MADQITFDFGPDIPRSGVVPKQDFNGFAQFRKEVQSLWLFCLCGFDSTFSGEVEYAVLRIDGGKAWVPIDADDRISIVERSYDRRHWNL